MFLQEAQKTVIEGVTGTIHGKGSLQGSTNQSHITYKIKNFVPDKFIAKTQALRVHHTVFIKHDGIFKRIAKSQTRKS